MAAYGTGQGAPAAAGLDAFRSVYSNFSGTRNIALSYSASLRGGYYGALLSLFSPTITVYRLNGSISSRISIRSLFYGISVQFYEQNGTTIYCLGSSTWFSSSVARCGLVGNLTRSGIDIYSVNLSSGEFSNVTDLGVRGSGAGACGAFSGEYSGSLLRGLLSKVGLGARTGAVFNVCLNERHGYVQQLNVSIGGYEGSLTAAEARIGGAQESDFEAPVSFVADWPSCNGSSVGFYYVPTEGASDPYLTISPESSQVLLARETLNGSFKPYGMYRIGVETGQPVHSGENLSVCIGGTCGIMQCQ